MCQILKKSGNPKDFEQILDLLLHSLQLGILALQGEYSSPSKEKYFLISIDVEVGDKRYCFN